MSEYRAVKHVLKAVQRARRGVVVMLLSVWLWPVSPAMGQATTLYPMKDGTLADGGTYGLCDGVADDADWFFNGSSYEGSVRLSRDEGTCTLEHRVVWEYDLSSVSLPPPVSAVLAGEIRGAPIWPFPDMQVHVYSYPADLVESLDDYSSGPAVLQGIVVVSPSIPVPQPPAVYALDVSAVVNAAMASGEDKVAFRFQIDPASPYDSNQAFIEALDSDPETKPLLTVDVPDLVGDINDDGVVDMLDADALVAVLLGTPQQPSHVDRADLNGDGTANGLDIQPFVYAILNQ